MSSGTWLAASEGRRRKVRGGPTSHFVIGGELAGDADRLARDAGHEDRAHPDNLVVEACRVQETLRLHPKQPARVSFLGLVVDDRKHVVGRHEVVLGGQRERRTLCFFAGHR